MNEIDENESAEKQQINWNPEHAWKSVKLGGLLKMNSSKHIVAVSPAINLFHRRIVIVQQHVKVDQPSKGSHFKVALRRTREKKSEPLNVVFVRQMIILSVIDRSQ